jgi:hypothetical protein
MYDGNAIREDQIHGKTGGIPSKISWRPRTIFPRSPASTFAAACDYDRTRLRYFLKCFRKIVAALRGLFWKR